MLAGRGYIREGAYADFTVFNEDTIKAAAPDQGQPFGIERVIINGKMVLEGGKINAEALTTSGRALKC
jgi:N-acyl-D-aspartate/D-glutamate deacylase